MDSMPSKISERKPYLKLPSLREKQRSVRVSEMQHQLDELREELMRAKEERSRALEELVVLKKMNGESMQSKDKIRLIELQAEKAKVSERKMLDSMISQTKQLEQTKISLEEAKLEIRNLQESKRKMENSAMISGRSLYKDELLESVSSQEEMRKLRNELRLALEAEEKSKKAMDDFAIALKEVATDANQAKAEIAVTRSELEKTREEAKYANSLLQSTEQKLLETLDGYDKMRLEYEETAAAWKTKEDSFLNCMKISEEEITKLRQENIRLNDVWRVAREENSKLRDIIKQAVNESTVVKEALEIARNENYMLKDQLFEKGNALQQIRQDFESLKVSEAAALDSVRELKNLLASGSAADSKKASNLTEAGSFGLSKPTIHDAKISKVTPKFPSERWKHDGHQVQKGRRHSMGEPEMVKCSTFDKEGSLESKKMTFSSISNLSDIRVPSSLLSDERGILNSDSFDHLEGMSFNDTGKKNHNKKKTVFGRLGDALRRKSVHKY